MENSVPKPEVFVKALLQWLSARCGQKYTFTGRKLSAGSQRDTISCGFFAMNAISRGVFGVDLLKHQDVRGNRLAWFNDLCKVIVQQVITSIPSLKRAVLIVCDMQNEIRTGTVHNPIHDVGIPDLSDNNYDTVDDLDASRTSGLQQVTSSPEPLTDYTPLESSPSPQPPVPTVKITSASSQKTLHGYFHLPAKVRSSNLASPSARSQTLKRQRLQNEEGDPPASKKPRAQGTSKSSLAEAKSRAEADKGVFNHKKFERFRGKILLLDPHAEFLIDNNPRFVTHSKCAEVNKQKATYNTYNFANHVRACTGPSKKRAHIANTDKKCFTDFVTGSAPGSSAVQSNNPRPDITLPCPGLTPEYDPRIGTYLARSQAAGGGSRPRHVISQEMFGKALGDLDKDELSVVCRTEATEFQWLNFREQKLIHSSACLKKIPPRQDPTLPCSQCMVVVKNQIFKNALHRPLPKPENLKFTPQAHRATLTGEQYAKTVGVYDLVCKASNVSFFLTAHCHNPQ